MILQRILMALGLWNSHQALVSQLQTLLRALLQDAGVGRCKTPLPGHLLCVSFHPEGTQEGAGRTGEEGLIPSCLFPAPAGITLVPRLPCSQGCSFPEQRLSPVGDLSSTGGAGFITSQPQRHQLAKARLQASTFS